jgi:hypothetical protein
MTRRLNVNYISHIWNISRKYVWSLSLSKCTWNIHTVYRS